MTLSGSLPSGCTEIKLPNDPWSPQVMNGGESAIARAFARGEPATVAFLLHAAPNLQPHGTYWELKEIHSRHDIERWVEDCYNGEEGEKVERAAGALEGFDLDAEEAVLPDEDKTVTEMQPTAMLGGSNQPPLVDRLRELTAAKESGVLSEEEFQAARKLLLDRHMSSML